MTGCLSNWELLEAHLFILYPEIDPSGCCFKTRMKVSKCGSRESSEVRGGGSNRRLCVF